MGAAEIFGVEEVTDKRAWRAFLAEFFGTFTVVFIGTATVEVVGQFVDIGRITRISFGFGLVVASVIKAHYHLSGGHVNPAVTISFMISGHIKFLKALIYIVCQFVAAILASFLLKFISPDFGAKVSGGELGLTKIPERITPVHGLIMEIILTFMVVLIIQGLFDPERVEIKGSKPLAVGIAVIAAHMAGIPWTGCSINPARSLGPAVATNNYKNIWIYFVGPFTGAILAAVFYRFVLKKPVIEE